MSITLEKVEQVKSRTGVSYKAAKLALEHTEGDVLEAIVYLEETEEYKTYTSESADGIHQFGQEISNFFKDIIKKGNVTRISLEKDGRLLVDLPIAAGAIGALFFAPATIVSIVAAFATGCELRIVKEDGEVINVKDVTKETLESVKKKINNTGEKVEKACENVEKKVDDVVKDVEEAYEEVRLDDQENQ